MSHNAYNAYQNKQNNFEDGRHTEYRLLVQVTAALLASQETVNDLRPRIQAAQWNRDVWAALRIDLMSEMNGLPADLKTALIALAKWSEEESLRVITGNGDVDALIEINRNIMAGLKPADEATLTTQATITSDVLSHNHTDTTLLANMHTSEHANTLLNVSSA